MEENKQIRNSALSWTLIGAAFVIIIFSRSRRSATRQMLMTEGITLLPSTTFAIIFTEQRS
ncbi:MAG: hypothetical protein II740_08010 [Lachnospiraceae bacterium]|nr:hypothetical protein [Lachnospiraceae bacterium]